ncbi:porin-like protein [Luteibacter rhizovicinus]|uniref:Porin-like protein n=1 Tax=Luteibacter rhizovicinus TaxID=242606 RepID=A0A4R3YTA0_9GAMM|nr:DcaP family trimeric outer membrane transporter [Luteibacter rhizovicinus]TCV94544.1 porin-like protein [Luteibacter rhizovicinus]
MRKGLLVCAMVVGLLASTGAVAQDDTKALKEEVESLRETVRALQARLDSVEANQRSAQSQSAATTVPAPARPPTGVPPPPAVMSVSPAQKPAIALGIEQSRLPEQQSVSDNATGASRIDNRPPPNDPELKGFIPIPGTETMIRIGGYAKLDAIYDTHDAGNREQFIPATFPIGDPNAGNANFNMHARQTRFSFEARRPTDYGNLRFYLENDFFGGGSDAYQFHLRQAFGQIGNTYAGYGYSSFMDADALPDTLDFAGPGGQMFLLQPGIHQAFELSQGNSITISAERPSSEVAVPDVDHPVTGTTRVPDVVLAGRIERAWGHVQASAVVRRLGYARDGRGDYTMAGGVALAGALATFGDDLLMFSGAWGKGIARYLSDTSGSGLDAVVGADGQLKALKTWGGYGAYTHYWSKNWRSSAVYGMARTAGSNLLASNAFRDSNYAAANLIWSPAPTWTMGVEVLHGRLRQQDGSTANDTRVQGSLQYSFVK